jgi:hypothetical protein
LWQSGPRASSARERRSSEEGDAEKNLLPGKGHAQDDGGCRFLWNSAAKDGITDLSLAGWQAERKGGKNGGERTAGFVKQNLKLFG